MTWSLSLREKGSQLDLIPEHNLYFLTPTEVTCTQNKETVFEIPKTLTTKFIDKIYFHMGLKSIMLEQLLSISVWALYSIAAVEKLHFFPYLRAIILMKQIPCWQGMLVTEIPDHNLNSSLSRKGACLSPIVHIATGKLAPRQYYLRIREPQLQKSSHLSGLSCTRIQSAPSSPGIITTLLNHSMMQAERDLRKSLIQFPTVLKQD